MKKLLALLLALLLICALLPAQAAAYRIGDTIPDFSITTVQGDALSLHGLLEKHSAVLINFWYVDCSWCGYEFPYLEQAWQQLAGDVAVLALSPYDSVADIAAYQVQNSLTFYMAQDTANLSTLFNISGFPTTVLIDRHGVYCLREEGAQASAQAFTDMIAPYVSADYGQSLLSGVTLPTVAAPSQQALRDALGEDATFYFSDSPVIWPWLVQGNAVRAANTGTADSEAQLYVRVDAQAGDALCFDVFTSTMPVFDRLLISCNGQLFKTFSGETSTRYTLAFEQAGSYDICFAYLKQSSNSNDIAQISNLQLLHGQQAAAALADNPQYPLTLSGTALQLTLTEDTATEITVDDPLGYLRYYCGDSRFYIAAQEPLTARFELGDKIDPDAAIVYNQEGARPASTAQADDSGFTLSCALNGEAYDQLLLLASLDEQDNCASVIYFKDESAANDFLQYFGAAWQYAAAQQAQAAPLPDGDAAYTLRFVDQHGAPVTGVMVNICSDTSCFAPVVTAADGLASFTGAPYAYEVHLLHVPDGYTLEDGQALILSPGGGETVLTLTKE